MCKGFATVAMLLLSLFCPSLSFGHLPIGSPPEGENQPDGSPSGELPDVPPAYEVLHSSMVGVGWSNILDTYLSPYNYTGTDIRIQRETMRMTTLWGGRVSNQSLIDINGAINENHAGNLDEYAIGIRYSQGWLYNFAGGNTVNPLRRSSSSPSSSSSSSSPWNFAAGLAASGYVGGVYIDRSGNNPGQARMELMVDATAMVTFDMRIARHHYLWRYQFSAPLIGIAFSPRYGQSYYEIFKLEQHDRNVVFAYVGNMPSMRHRLTLDIPIRRYTIRFGYVGQFNQSTFNHLKYHQYSHNFVLGFNKYLYRR